jgi:hypothetical protein
MAKSFDCDKCSLSFGRGNNLKRHVLRFHSGKPIAKIGRPKFGKQNHPKKQHTASGVLCDVKPKIMVPSKTSITDPASETSANNEPTPIQSMDAVEPIAAIKQPSPVVTTKQVNRRPIVDRQLPRRVKKLEAEKEAEYWSSREAEIFDLLDIEDPAPKRKCDGVERDAKRQKVIQDGGGITGSAEPFFETTLLNETEERLPVFNGQSYSAKYHIKHNLANVALVDFEAQLDALFENLLKPVYDRAHDNDLVCVTITHEELGDSDEMYTRDVHISGLKKNYKVGDVLTKIYELAQSNSRFMLDGELDLKASIFRKSYRSYGSRRR